METNYYNEEEMNYKYRIVCYIDDTWVVQERTPEGDLMSIHHCELKGEQGYYEAMAWMSRKEAEK